jgi:hypothetical protein
MRGSDRSEQQEWATRVCPRGVFRHYPSQSHLRIIIIIIIIIIVIIIII